MTPCIFLCHHFYECHNICIMRAGKQKLESGLPKSNVEANLFARHCTYTSSFIMLVDKESLPFVYTNILVCLETCHVGHPSSW